MAHYYYLNQQARNNPDTNATTLFRVTIASMTPMCLLIQKVAPQSSELTSLQYVHWVSLAIENAVLGAIVIGYATHDESDHIIFPCDDSYHTERRGTLTKGSSMCMWEARGSCFHLVDDDAVIQFNAVVCNRRIFSSVFQITPTNQCPMNWQLNIDHQYEPLRYQKD